MIIFDQIETEPITSYSGSYSDNIIFGSLFKNNIDFLSSTIDNSTRQIAALKTTGITQKYLSKVSKWRHSRYHDFINSRQIAGSVSNFTVVENDKTIVDSVTPDIVQIATINNEWVFSGSYTFLSDPDLNAIATPVSSSANVIIRKYSPWLTNFPFQTEYKQVDKNFTFGRNLQVITASMTTLVNITFQDPSGDVFTLVDISSSNPTVDFAPGVVNFESYWPTQFLELPFNIQNKFFYSIGDGFLPKTGISTKLKRMPGFLIRQFPDPDFLAGMVIRGFRYGLYNSSPVHAQIKFRRSRYGHFRDMLEPRIYTAFTDINGNIEFPVQINFISGSDISNKAKIYVTASSPTDFNRRDSGMFDAKYRSGQPFFDG